MFIFVDCAASSQSELLSSPMNEIYNLIFPLSPPDPQIRINVPMHDHLIDKIYSGVIDFPVYYFVARPIILD